MERNSEISYNKGIKIKEKSMKQQTFKENAVMLINQCFPKLTYYSWL
jgi:hypothetical protein